MKEATRALRWPPSTGDWNHTRRRSHRLADLAAKRERCKREPLQADTWQCSTSGIHHSFLLRTVSEWNLLPTAAISSVPSLSPSRVSSLHSLQPVPTSPWTSCVSFWLQLSCFIYYYYFNNTQGTDRDHLLTTHRCGTCNTLTEPSP